MKADSAKPSIALALIAAVLLAVAGGAAAKRSFRNFLIGSVAQRPLGFFGGIIPYSAEDAKANILILGPTGVGKTTGPFYSILADFLRAGHGASITIAKSSDGDDLMKLVRRCGAENRTIRIRPGSGNCINPLQWLCSCAADGGTVDLAIVRLVMQLSETLDRRKGNAGHGEDSYFRGFSERTLFFASLCCRIAYGTVTFHDLLKFVTSLPGSPEHAVSDSFKAGFGGKTLLLAAEGDIGLRPAGRFRCDGLRFLRVESTGGKTKIMRGDLMHECSASARLYGCQGCNWRPIHGRSRSSSPVRF